MTTQHKIKANTIHKTDAKSNPSFAKKQELYPYIKININDILSILFTLLII